MVDNTILDTVFKALPSPSILLKIESNGFKLAKINEAYALYLGLNENVLQEVYFDELYRLLAHLNNLELLNQLKNSFERVNKTQQEHNYKTSFSSPTNPGKTHYISIKNIPINDDNGKLAYILHTIKDNTDKETSKSELENLNTKFKGLVNTIEGVFWEADAATFEFTYISPQVESILGYTPEEWLSQPDFWQKHLYKADKEEAISYCHQQTLQLKNHTFEHRIYKANGEVIWVKDIVSVISEDGKPRLLRGLILDINHLKLLEIERAEIAKRLVDRNIFIETIINNTPIGIGVNHLNNNTFSVINEQFIDILESSKEDLENKKVVDQLADKIYALNENINEFKTWENVEILTKTDKKKYITVRSIPVKNQDLTITTLRDTTIQNKNYKELERIKNELSRVMEHSVDLVTIIDENGIFSQVSNSAKTILGYNPKELVSKSYLAYVEDSYKDLTKKIALNLRNTIEISNFQNFYYKKDGTTIPLLWSVKWIEEEKKYYGICKDATEKLAYENKILASEKNYKNLFENNPSPMFIWDVETLKIIDCNEEALLLYGYEKDEFLDITIKDLRPKHEIPLLEKTLKNDAHFGHIHKKIWGDVKKTGELIYVNVSGHIIDYNGRKSSLVTAIDVTEKIKLEQQQEFEKREKEALINNTDDLIWSADVNFNLIAGNSSFLNRLKAHTNKDFKRGDYLLDEKLFPKAYIKLWKQWYSRALKGQSFKEVITSQIENEGTFWAEISFNPIKNEQNITGIACRSSNITEKKLAEERIIRSEANLAEAQRLTKLGSWELDLQNNQLIISKELYHILDFDDENQEISLNDIFETVADEFKDAKKKVNDDLLNTGEPFSIEFDIISKKKRRKTILEHGYGKKDENGKLIKIIGTAQDVTKIKQLENKQKALLEKQQLLHSIVDSTEDAIISKTLEGRITSWNKGAEIIFGHKEKEVLGKHISIIIPDNLLYEKNAIMETVVTGKHVHNYETTRQHKNGSSIDVSLTVSPIFNSEKTIIGISVIARDIKEKKKAELDLLNAFKEKENILESIGDGFFTVDNSLRVTYWNKVAEKELNTPTENVLGKRLFKDAFQESKNSISAEKYKEALLTHNQINFTDHHPLTDSYYDVSVYPSANGLSVYFKNTTEERRILQQFEAVTQNMPGITYRCKIDENWSMVFLSDGVKEVTGYLAEDLINNNIRSFASIIHPDDVDDAYQIERSIRAKKVFSIEYRIIRKDGVTIWVEDIGRGVFNNDDELEYIDGVILDITSRKANEAKLQKLNKELKTKATKLAASNNELEQFAYVASHDLQEPLRMITSFLTLLKNKYQAELGEEGDKYIYYAVDGAQRMRKIILDLLEFSKVGKTNKNKELVNINLIIENICILFTNQIKQSGAQINYSNLPSIVTYSAPIQQIFSNLIGNSLKYGAHQINVTHTETKKHWHFSVRDDGIGINPMYFEKIFVIFQRLHNKDNYAGTGIGLAITKKIVENLGGKIWLESEEGKGSTFHFTILKQH